MPDSPANLETHAAAASAATEWAAHLGQATERQATFLRRLIPFFLSECPELLAAIRQAIAEGNAVQLKYAAHTLKSSTSFFAGQTVMDALLQLESMGRTGDLTGAEAASTNLQAALAALLPVLADFANLSKEIP